MSTQEFTNLVLTHADGLKPFAITLTRDHEEARDLCQETLYKAFANREKYQQGTNVKAWLATIMRNIFINDYRRDGRKKQILDAVAYTGRYANRASADSTMQLKEVNRAIYHLPGIFKSTCQLYLEGYKYNEIALALNEPLGTIKSRIHFAKKLLQNQLDR